VAPGLVSERALEPERFAIGGVPPRFAARPLDRDELCELLRAAARDALAVVPWGGATALPREAAPARYDLAIDLGALDRVIEYEPGDLTLTAECGVTLAALDAALAARGQELPLEAAHAARATLGGTLAANASGPRRRRFGAPRDRILGARFVLGDGTLVRTGGKVVKNVAGYGIHRLLCGSRGGLAIFVDASLKLLPAPAARAALIYEVDAGSLGDAARWSPFPCLEPAVLTIVGAAGARGGAGPLPGAGGASPPEVPGARGGADPLPGASGGDAFWLAIGFEDDPSRIAELEAITTRALGAPALKLEGADAEAVWQRLADLEDSGSTRLTFVTAHNTPAALARWLGSPELGACVFHAPCGTLHVFPEPRRAQACVAELAALGFSLTRGRGADVVAAIPPGAATKALRGRVRAALDPGARFALGERWERSTG